MLQSKFLKNLLSLAIFNFLLANFLFSQITADFSVKSIHFCAPSVVEFTNNSSTGEGILYQWDFGKSSANPPASNETDAKQIYYNDAGQYTISLIAFKKGAPEIADTASVTIILHNLPKADFSFDDEKCAPAEYVFTQSVTEGDTAIVDYEWFVDGQYFETPNTTLNFNQAGDYQAVLLVRDLNGCESTISKDFGVKEKPTADFIYKSNGSCKPPFEISFENTSVAPYPVDYEWKWQTEIMSTEKTPDSKTVDDYNQYTVSLSAKGELQNCVSSSSQKINLTDFGANIAVFKSSTANGEMVANGDQVGMGTYTINNSSVSAQNFKWQINGEEYTDNSITQTFCKDTLIDITLISGIGTTCPDTSKFSFSVFIDQTSSFLFMNESDTVFEGETGKNMDARLISPPNVSEAIWSVEGMRDTGKVIDIFICTPGEKEIVLFSNYNNQCFDTVRRSIQIENRMKYDYSIFHRGSEIQPGAKVCIDTITFVNNMRIYPSVWEHKGITSNKREADFLFCSVGANSANLITTYNESCKDSLTVTVNNKKCYGDDFVVYRYDDEIVDFNSSEKNCPGLYTAVPDSATNFIKWEIGFGGSASHYSTLDSVFKTSKENQYTFRIDSGTTKITMTSKLEENKCIDVVSHKINRESHNFEYDIKNLTKGCPYPFSGQITSDLELGDNKLYWKIGNTNQIVNEELPFFTIDGTQQKEEYPRKAYTTTEKITAVIEGNCLWELPTEIEKKTPAARMRAYPTTGCAPLPVRFDDDSRQISVDSAIVSYTWIWGDGTSDTFSNQTQDEQLGFFTDCINADTVLSAVEKSNIFTLMNYIPSDTVQINCDDEISYYDKIDDCKCVTDKKMSFFTSYTEQFDTVEERLGCIDYTENLSGKSPIHVYTQAGTYEAKLIVAAEDGCTDTARLEITVGDSIDATVTISAEKDTLTYGDELFISFNSDLIDDWEFSDNKTNLSKPCGINPSSIPLNGYEYGPLNTGMTAYNNGCPSEVDIEFESGLGSGGALIMLPWFYSPEEIEHGSKATNYLYSGSNGNLSVEFDGCKSQIVTFNYKPSSSVQNWGLDLGDGNVVYNKNNFVHEYDSGGVYQLSIIKDIAQPNQKTHLTTFYVPGQVKAKITVSEEDTLICSFREITLSAGESQAYAKESFEPFLWYIDNLPKKRTWKDTATFDDFYQVGSYDVMLVVYDENRCTDTAHITIRTTKPAPDFKFVKDHICAPEDTVKARVLFNDNSIEQWMWFYEGSSKDDTVFNSFGTDTVLNVAYKTKYQTSKDIYLIAQDTIGCRDTIAHSITQYAPQASFIANREACAGVPLQLTDKSSFADSTAWFSDNADISKEASPKVVYNQRGEYLIGLAAFSQGNCTDTAYANISVQEVDASFSASKNFICRNDEITFSQHNVPDPVENRWRFTTSQRETQNVSSPTPIDHTFNYGGTFTVSLTATTSHGCTDTYDTIVKVLSAKPYIEDRTLCVGDSAFFINPDGFANYYEYDFGNGSDTTVNSNARVGTQYTTRGTYTITASAYSDECSDTYTQKMVTVQQADATFTVSDSIVCNFYPPGEANKNFVQFSHSNIPDPVAFGEWSFSDNTGTKPYKEPLATYHYTTPGIVNTSLEVTTTYGCVDKTEKKIIVNGTLGEFGVDRNEICIHDEVGFVPYDLVNVDSLIWIFDDGLASLDELPSHAYHEAGAIYPVLQLYDTSGCLNIIGPEKIMVYEIIADFSVDNSLLCEHDTLQITENCSSTTNWHWDFGNGDISLEQDPETYAYNTADKYTITLTASNHINCADTATAEIEVFPVPDPQFGLNKEFLCAPSDELLMEYIASDTTIVDFVWSFGDENGINSDSTVYYNFDESTRKDSSLSHIYMSAENDEYIVALAATDFRGCKNRAEKHLKLHAPDVEFTVLDPLGCKGEAVEIINNSSSVDSVVWLYGNEETERSLTDVAPVYSKRGDYTITAIGYKMGRCTDTLSADVNIEEIYAEFKLSDDYICDDDSVKFTQLQVPDSVFGTWTFGSGESSAYTLASDTVKWFTYEDGGTYIVSLDLETENGCKDLFTDTILVNEAKPVFNDTTICAGNTIEVENITGLAETYIWDFGNGVRDTVTTNDKISVKYTSRGNYTVSLIAQHQACNDTVVVPEAINVQEIDANFSMTDTLACDEEFIRFVHLATPDSVSGTWAFGDGDMQNYQTPLDSAVEHAYQKGGIYTVELQVATSNGCEMAVSKEIAVNKANPVISDKAICKEDIIQLHNNTSQAKSYTWMIAGVDTLKNSDNTIFDLQFTQRGTYSLTLIAEHPSCTDTIQLDSIIKVEEINADFSLSDERICNVYPDTMDQKNLVVMTHLYSPDSITAGRWMLNGAEIQKYATPDSVYSAYQHLINKLGENILALEVATTNGCKDTRSKSIWVDGSEGAFSISKNSICKGEEITFTASNLVQAEKLEWVYGDSNRSNRETHTYKYDTIGNFAPYLILFNASGCINPLAPKALYINEVIADFSTPDPKLCIGEVLNVVDKSKMSTKWNWNFDNGSTQTVQTPVNVSYGKAGEYTVELITFDDIMCSDTISKKVTVYPHPPLSLEAAKLVCLDSTANIKAIYDQRNNISWFKDGTAFEGNIPEISDPFISDTATYRADITDTLGCKNSKEITVNIRPYPIYNQNLIDTAVLIAEKVMLNITSNYPSEFVWTPDLNVIENNNNTITVQALESTVYTVAVSDTCHTQEFSFSVNMIPINEVPCRAALPTAFSPNNDGENDIFKIRGWGIKGVKFFRIYNRLGQKVFETTDISHGWDGTFKSKAQGIETYTYHFLLETFCGEDIEQKGYVDLVR